jgi:hypothetical protein
MHAFEANAFTSPIPIFFPTVGGCLYSGDFVVRKVAAIDPQFCQFTFEVGQIVEKLSETDVTINYFATGKTTIRTYLPLLPESLIPYAAIKTNVYQKCKTSDFRSLAYVVHAEKKDKLLVDPEGILNTYTVTYQYIVGRNSSIIPYPSRQHFASAADVYAHSYPRLASMPRRMFEACRAISSTSVSMLSRGAINQALCNTRRVHVERDIFEVVEKEINYVTRNLRVAIAQSDVPVTVSIRKLRVLENTDVQVSSTKYRDKNEGKKNRKLFHTNQQVKKLKTCFGVHFGYGSRSPFPPTSVTKHTETTLVEEHRMLHDNSVLNSILNTPSDTTEAGKKLAHIPIRGLPNGLVMTYQDINHSVVMSMRFDKVRAGARDEAITVEAAATVVPQSPSRIPQDAECDSNGSVSVYTSLAGSEFSPQRGDCFAYRNKEYNIVTVTNGTSYLCRDIIRPYNYRIFSRNAVVHLTSDLGSVES